MLSTDSLGTQQFFLYGHDMLLQVNFVSGIDLIDRLRVNCVFLSPSEDVGLLFSPAA